MPNFSGIWTVTQQMQAKGASTWPALPGAPTIGTATVASGTSASVAFTAPASAGYPTTLSYTATSTPGCFTNTGASSPIVVSGLTTGTAYTFKVKAANGSGTGPCSAASNSVTPVAQGQQAYTTAGSYTWVAPACVTSVSVVAVGGGGRYGAAGLGYKNNYSVTAGSSYTVSVGAGVTTCSCSGGDSYFVSGAVVQGGGGTLGTSGTYVGDGGGNGGSTSGRSPGSGAGGYSGNGGNASSSVGTGNSGSGGGGGGGGRGINPANCQFIFGGGGGVGILGEGANGGGGYGCYGAANGGGGGSGGAAGGNWSSPPSGGAYGGGAGPASVLGVGGSGAVRVIWPGATRQFPSTNTGNV